jgi:hypothetical protein
MKTKIFLWSGVSILVIGLAAAIWWFERPQVILFGDDSKVTLVGKDFGKRHTPPSVRGSTRRNSFTTTEDTLVLWFRQEYDSKEWHNFQYFLYDKSGTACVGSSGMNYGNRGRQGSDLIAVEFSAFPRRQGKFLVGVQENSNGSQEIADRKFSVSNPARGSFAKWTAEPLPATKEDEDLAVTLTKLVFGANTTYNRNQDNPDDPINKGVEAGFQVQRSGKPVNNWQPVSVQTSDATGNHVSGWCNTQWSGNDGTTTYQWGLWSDEPAWKIRFEFSQQSDFADNELWTVRNIPLQPGRMQDFWNYGGRQSKTIAPFAEADVNGVHLKILPAKHFTEAAPNSQQQGGLTIQADGALPEGMRMTLVKITDDQTNDIGYWDSGTSRNNKTTNYRYQLRELYGVTNLNVTLALHKSRFVEFTAKPEKAAAADAKQ